MKYLLISVMLIASIVAVTGCSADDPFEEFDGGNGWNDGSMMPGGNGSSTMTGGLATFDIVTDQTTAEPTDVAEEYFPDEEDARENN